MHVDALAAAAVAAGASHRGIDYGLALCILDVELRAMLHQELNHFVPAPESRAMQCCLGAAAAVDLALATASNNTMVSDALQHQLCTGDCNGDGPVTVNELLTAVSIALGNQPLGKCGAADINDDGQITVDEMVTSINRALNGCGIAP